MASKAPVGPVAPHCSDPGCCTQSCGHHVTIMPPCVIQATSLAIHLTGIHGSWGFQPSFPAIPVSYALLMSLFRLQDQWIQVFSHSRIGGCLYAPVSPVPGSTPCPPHADSRHCY